MSRGIKGGTIIAEDVLDLETHEVRLLDPDAYRPATCGRCGSKTLHAHCFRERCLRGAVDAPATVTIRLFRCTEESCRAVFTVLPAFLARHLWRLWKSVEDAVRGRDTVPKTTLWRWLRRLESDASQLVQIFTASLSGAVTKALSGSRPTTRNAFTAALEPFLGAAAPSFALTAAWIHRLAAGVRFM